MREIRDDSWVRGSRRVAVSAGLFLFFAVVLVMRRPDCLMHSQFWAEDGYRFYPNALQRPAWLNLVTYSYGYFDVLLRLSHQIAALFPLRQAPRVLALTAVVIQAAVPTFVVSTRTKQWLGPFPIRLAAALLYCAMPNSFEVHAIALHARVHLAVLASLIVVAAPPVTLPAKIFDVVILVLSALSGPFVFVLFPAALWRYLRTHGPKLKTNLAVLLLTLPFGLFALLFSTSRRLVDHLAANTINGVRIVGGQLTISFFLGEKSYAGILSSPWFDTAAWTALGVLLLLLILILRCTSLEVECLLLIGFGLLTMALVAPLAGLGRPAWVALWSVPGCGQRYYFPVMAVLLFSLAALAGRAQRSWQRGVGFCCLLIIAVMGARVDFVLPPFADFRFNHYARLYRKLPAGGVLAVPINPPGWVMTLRKPGG